MPVTIEKIPDAPIVVIHGQQATGDIAQDTVDTIAQMTRCLDEQPEPVFLVVDMRKVSLGLDDVIRAASAAARGQDSMLHHPNIREHIYVLADGLIKMAVKGLDSATFGQIKARVFDTLEEALDYCQQQPRANTL